MDVQVQPTDQSLPPQTEEWEEDEDYDDDDSSSSDSDIDAEAQELARRLGEQLWADLNSGSAAGPAELTPAVAQPTNAVVQPEGPTPYKKAEEAALHTINTVLQLLINDPQARNILASTSVPELGGNVFDLLQQCATSKSISKANAMPLSQVLVSLARSEQLFSGLRHSDASAVQLQQGKRKLDEMEEAHLQDAGRVAKRPFIPEQDLQTQVTNAVQGILQAFASAPTPLDPTLISSIRLQLHQVFLFAVTSSARGGPEMHPLQEISGLIQVVGVLSGIQIGQGPEAAAAASQYPPGSYPWIPGHGPPPATDIGTAVYPCLITGCKKIFSRLYNLRAHQRNHAVHRPFRCTACPASFARNHDLKRHVKLHDRKAWKCGSCQKIFSRRDAFKRHTNSSKTRGPRDTCTDADVIEVELDDESSHETHREERRAKLWTGIANGSMQGFYREHATMEEGEIHESIIHAIQGSVMTLHPVLQGLVGNVLGIPAQPGQPDPHMTDAAGSQATLASVIARAQSQNLPSALPPDPSMVHQPLPPPEVEPAPPPQDVEMTAAPAEGPQHDPGSTGTSLAPLTMYGLSDEQTKLLELAIANAALAAQAQAEAEAALEEEDEDEDEEEEEEEDEAEEKEAEAPSAEPVT
ncbi:hypothetical protein CC1G_03253 [Coprinopsis cinerea okayama7|uniref:C2H2-type domain-containing protein n=1 Tax=Coprinopsis cinerea (strain Okayama-7 / 130 / ATCC MYA-4618 / FGSC 9003) TaxID=240176 RepID=A8N7B0_COPC7|nr:hypothetical protein CC1G_03253 [Coprinopsis cinerea okayama7\|eukprot:XP_001830716.1 hypothetical protein CC1G_03253 [Coprinopsis cinerea okayama7\